MAAKRTSKNAPPRKGTPRKSRRAKAPKSAPRARPAGAAWLSPQQQRELFACALIGLGLLLLVLFLSVNRGVIGAGMVSLLQTAFGSSGVAIPLLLIALGGLLLWQERFIDAPLSGGNLLGVLMLALVFLTATEFAATRTIYELQLDAPSSVGGAIALGLMQAFGVAGAGVLLLLGLLLGVMMTFNLTLTQLVGLLGAGMRRLLELLQGPRVEVVAPEGELNPEPVPYAEELKTRAKPRTPPAPPAERTPATRPAPEAEPQRQVIYTPIAARPTQASLFQRPEAQPTTGETVRREAPPPRDTPPDTPAAEAVTQPLTPARAAPPPPGASPTDEAPTELETGGPRQAWPLPSLDLLDPAGESEVDDNEKRVKARIIEETLASFKIEAQVVGMNPGPAVTQYLLQPAVGVKVSRIVGLDRDLALALAAPSVRIEAPIPGTPYIGIEIPNSAIASVAMREVIDSDEYRLHKGKLKLALGKDVSGTPVITDLTRAPHLLIAGSTGSGKSIAINSIVCTLLMQHTPDDLKFIMIDPKMVELIVYNHIPHLLSPVVTELERVVSLLKWAVREMERRYKLLAQKGYRNIESYNRAARSSGAGLEPLPYIVIIIDELADLMMMAPDEVETLVCRLAQMARAIGIHLILATQRPSVDVVTGLIKANFPTRMAFAVTSQIDSRVILDQSGAEHLLGRGDMLYLAVDAAKPIRVQGTFVSDREIEQITNFWRNAGLAAAPATRSALPLKATPEQDAAASSAQQGLSSAGVSPLPESLVGRLSAEEEDELLPRAIDLVRQHERASASLLQRRLRIGYSKAAQLLDLLEQRGIVGPPDGGRSREVLLDRDDAPEV
ncbi:DNA translocase FtsK [Kallotenue papyrolyticum]|uniref:DNA translocase FtsK n=1 Tax=Kallotenue papyrolyticum TaxID=1325125 RepID=UPI000492C345|nr:DNA translocase FtsK [Kallotenue papyrolyticum]